MIEFCGKCGEPQDAGHGCYNPWKQKKLCRCECHHLNRYQSSCSGCECFARMMTDDDRARACADAFRPLAEAAEKLRKSMRKTPWTS